MLKISLFIGIILIILSVYELTLINSETDIYQIIKVVIIFLLGLYNILRGIKLIPKNW